MPGSDVYEIDERSITPLHIYIARWRSRVPGALDDLTLVTFLREREYLELEAPHRIHVPPRTPSPLWEPHPLTPEARATIGRPNAKWDLFSTKALLLRAYATAGRRDVQTDMQVQLRLRLLHDLRRAASLVRLATNHLALCASVPAAAYLARTLDLSPRLQGSATLGELRRLIARTIPREQRVRPMWAWKLVDAVEEGHLDAALAVRRRVEPEFATRLTTRARAAAAHRATSMRGLRLRDVPPSLQVLLPFARAVGVADDALRADLLQRLSADRRKRMRALLQLHGQAVERWLATFSNGSTTEAARAFFWLMEAAEEMQDDDAPDPARPGP